MGLTNWSGNKVRQKDVAIAKNYLEKNEINELNQIVVMYLDYAEDQAKNRKTMTMKDWEQKLDAFLVFNERELLDHSGKISAEIAEKVAMECYEKFDATRREKEKKIANNEDMVLLNEIETKVKNLISEKPPKK